MKRKLESARQQLSKRADAAAGQSAMFHEESVETEATPCHARPKIGHAFSGSKSSTTGVTKFHGMLVEDLLFIEVFAGTAKLSKAAKDVGFQTLPIKPQPGPAKSSWHSMTWRIQMQFKQFWKC